MEIAVFAKKRSTKEGKQFFQYLATLTRKDGSTQVATVRFSEDHPAPKAEQCPMNIIVDKDNANLSKRPYTKPDTGETGFSYSLWVKNWKQGSPYVDHSLDDFE